MRYTLFAVLLALCACDRDDPQSRSAYNTVTTDSLTPRTATLWEYWRDGPNTESGLRYHRTGRHLSVRFPEAYYYFGQDVDGRDGVSKIVVRWDAMTGGPITRSAEARLGWEETRARAIEVELSHYGRVQHPIAPHELGTKLIDHPFGARTVGPGSDEQAPYRALGEAYCGFEPFDLAPPVWWKLRGRDGREHDARELLEAPFNRARLFARKNREGQYDAVVICEAVPTSGWCRIASDFRGWPMQLYFSGKHLCAFDRIREQSRALLAAHLAASSPRTEQPPAGAPLIPVIDDVPPQR